jgi:NAD(P)-dependent dehydrogenase (short-subunit alcohol dehydrogenase family)
LDTGTGRVAIVTGGGRGLGRAYAHLLAERGLRVVVNSAMLEDDGDSSAARVVAEIQQNGGTAVAHVGTLSSWTSADQLIGRALEDFGRLDALVNNAGLLRDRTIANMSEDEWDDVLAIHLKAQAATLHSAAAHWRDRNRAGEPVSAAVVNTTAGAGLYGNIGQANYAAAKAGAVGLTLVASRELERYGVRVNAIAPVARTRLTEGLGLPEPGSAPGEEATFDLYEPANVAPLVAYLIEEDCPLTGQVFNVQGGDIVLYSGWEAKELFRKQGRWTVDELKQTLASIPSGPPPFAVPRPGEPI